ncbi:hypothetical protein NKG94_26970 [Micromonospora sp. M12]
MRHGKVPPVYGLDRAATGLTLPVPQDAPVALGPASGSASPWGSVVSTPAWSLPEWPMRWADQGAFAVLGAATVDGQDGPGRPRGVSFYADPVAWLVADAVGTALAAAGPSEPSAGTDVGVVAVSEHATAHTMREVATAVQGRGGSRRCGSPGRHPGRSRAWPASCTDSVVRACCCRCHPGGPSHRGGAGPGLARWPLHPGGRRRTPDAPLGRAPGAHRRPHLAGALRCPGRMRQSITTRSPRTWTRWSTWTRRRGGGPARRDGRRAASAGRRAR